MRPNCSELVIPFASLTCSLKKEVNQFELIDYSQEVETISPKRGMCISSEIVALTHNLRSQPADVHRD